MKCSGFYFDRFDICEAYYCYAYNYHSGQNSPSYEIFGRLVKLQFKPRVFCYEPKTLSENAKVIFNTLVKNNL